MTSPFGPEHALVVVDLQHDFADPDGALYVRGGEDLLDPINKLIEEATTAGAALVYTQDWHPEVTPHFAKHGGLWPVHCVIDSPGADLLPGLKTTGPVIRKGSGPEDGYSGFSVLHLPTNETRETELDDFLKAHGATALVVAGGLARLVSLAQVGAPSPGHLFGFAMELGAVPLLMLWQAAFARRWQAAGHPPRSA